MTTPTSFKKSFEETGAIKNVAMFLNLADDPPVERIITPRAGLNFSGIPCLRSKTPTYSSS